VSAQGFNAADYLVTRHVSEGRGDRTAVVASETLTYAELDRRVGVVAAGLRSLGLRRDDRVLLVMSDEIPMLTTILGAFRAGLVAVPVSTMLTGKELGGIVADSGARAVVATPEFVEAVGQAVDAAPDVEHLVVTGDGALVVPEHVTVHTWQSLTEAGEAGDPSYAPTGDDSWALWLYTSGTTGLPKAAMHRHANIRHVCETYGAQVLGITPDDVTFSVAKLFFAYGIGNSMFFPFSVGAATVLEPRRPTPDVVRERLEQARPTLFFGVPTFYAALTAGDLPATAFESVRLCASAGEPLPAPLQNRFTGRFGVEILDGIGSTEALHIFLSNRPGDVRPGTTGLPVPGYEVELRAEDGSLVPDGEPGALHVRGESIALGYWHRTDASRAVFVGEWLKTGDTYVRSGEGYYTCLGRSSDMLKAGGIWVSPAEVESRLLEHPAVREAAVVGLPDADGLDKPVAVVVVVDGSVDEAGLVAWCREGLAHFKAPRRVVFVDDLPKTATGKLQRFKVRDFVAGAPAAEPPAEPSGAPVVAT
jgi:benzoate-CoA ligase family protein